MATLTVVAADVRAVRGLAVGTAPEQYTGPAAEAITAGQYVRFNVTTGQIELGKGTTAAEARRGGIAINGANIAGVTITMVRKGLIDMGDALGDLTYDDDVFLSDTDGVLADAAGTVSLVVGTVVPGYGATVPDKLLRVDL